MPNNKKSATNMDMTVLQYKNFRGTKNHKKELDEVVHLLTIELVGGDFIDKSIIEKEVKKFNQFLIREAIGILLQKCLS